MFMDEYTTKNCNYSYSIQWIKLPKSACRYERNLIMKINFQKNACSCQFHVEINANDANGCYPLRSMERIGSLRNIFTC